MGATGSGVGVAVGERAKTGEVDTSCEADATGFQIYVLTGQRERRAHTTCGGLDYSSWNLFRPTTGGVSPAPIKRSIRSISQFHTVFMNGT